MLLAPLSLLLLTTSISGEYLFGTPTNGKLVHDMRTFANVTFDWTEPQGWARIPECHEWRLRRSYFELHSPELTRQRIQLSDHAMHTGHLVYPILIGANGEEQGDFGYWAAAVHRVYNRAASRHIKADDKLIEIIIVSEQTWNALWMRWQKAAKGGLDLCKGGNFFSQILRTIRKEATTVGPQYQELVGNYTDLTSEYCTATQCRCPDREPSYDQIETLTLAYPTEEGLDQLVASPYFNGTKDATEVLNQARAASDKQLLSFMGECYEGKNGEKRKKNLPPVSPQEDKIAANQAVFYAPYI